MTKDELIERVASIDKAASKKLKRIYEKAAIDQKYVERINIINPTEDGETAAEVIGNLFIWDETEEGMEYWYNLKDKLEKANI